MTKPKEVFLCMEHAKSILDRHRVEYRTDGDRLEINLDEYILVYGEKVYSEESWIKCPNTYRELLELIAP